MIIGGFKIVLCFLKTNINYFPGKLEKDEKRILRKIYREGHITLLGGESLGIKPLRSLKDKKLISISYCSCTDPYCSTTILRLTSLGRNTIPLIPVIGIL